MAKLLVLLLLAAAACGGPTSANVDASGSGGGADGGGMKMDGGGSGSGSNCTPLVTTNLNNGHHNPGQDCMNGCHDHGFTAAGTLYKSANGTAMPGATITLTDSTGAKITMISQSNGNFYTFTPISFPATVTVSGCPNNAAMTAKVQASGAGCNQGGACHGGTQGPIHLP